MTTFCEFSEYFSWRGALDFNTHPFIFRLQVEILVKYEQLEYVLSQMSETTKKPRAGTSPLVAVPLRLDLTPEQVKKILRWNIYVEGMESPYNEILYAPYEVYKLCCDLMYRSEYNGGCKFDCGE